jgi:hypothetical protein
MIGKMLLMLIPVICWETVLETMKVQFLIVDILAELVEALLHADSIPDGVIGFFSSPNPSSCAMTLGSTQPLAEISTRNPPEGKR